MQMDRTYMKKLSRLLHGILALMGLEDAKWENKVLVAAATT